MDQERIVAPLTDGGPFAHLDGAGDGRNLDSDRSRAVLRSAVGEHIIAADAAVAAVDDVTGGGRRGVISAVHEVGAFVDVRMTGEDEVDGGVDGVAGELLDVPPYADAVMRPAKYEPGTRFEYGPVPFQVFGELMTRKLRSKNESVKDYLRRRILDPIGLKVAFWRDYNGQPLQITQELPLKVEAVAAK